MLLLTGTLTAVIMTLLYNEERHVPFLVATSTGNYDATA
jgi:hypothetical protein